VSRWEISERPGLRPAKLPGSLTSSSTTCAAPRPGTWCARVFPSASRWRRLAPWRAACSTATTSSVRTTSEWRPQDDDVRGHAADKASSRL